MASQQRRYALILEWSIVAVICSMIVGAIFYQDTILNRYMHTFIFVSDAALGALFFFTLRFSGQRDALLLLGVLYVLYLGPLTHAFQLGYTLSYTIFFFTTPLAVWLYFTSYYETGRAKIVWHPFIIGALLASTTLLARIIVTVLYNAWHLSWWDFPRAVFPQIWMAFLLGVGMGTGFALAEYRPFRRLFGLPA